MDNMRKQKRKENKDKKSVAQKEVQCLHLQKEAFYTQSYVRC